MFNANGERLGVLVPDSGVLSTGPAGYGAAGYGASGGGGGGGMDSGGNPAGANAGGGGMNAAGVDNGRAGSLTMTPELDRAARRELQHERQVVERKGQMMHSIAPRTNVDRTDQMPDDSSPLLSPRRP
jgi:hypothetical protein